MTASGKKRRMATARKVRMGVIETTHGAKAGHPNMNTAPSVDMSTGSLGQGISCAAGMALVAKHQGKSCRVYALLGDREIEESQVWEAFMLAHHCKLDNLCAVIDNNSLQIDGK